MNEGDAHQSATKKRNNFSRSSDSLELGLFILVLPRCSRKCTTGQITPESNNPKMNVDFSLYWFVNRDLLMVYCNPYNWVVESPKYTLYNQPAFFYIAPMNLRFSNQAASISL